MLKRSDVVALSKGALQRVASGRAETLPPNKKHTERLAKLKKAKKEHGAAASAYRKRIGA